jgi:hypothetical protein
MGAHARSARPPPSNRARRAPPIRGCAVGGATLRPRRTGGRHPAGGRVVRQQRRAATAPRDRTNPPSLPAGCHVIQRERPQPFPGIRRRKRRPAGRSGPLMGRPGVLRRHPPPALNRFGPTQAVGVPGRRQGDPFSLVMPRVGLVGRNNRGRLAPLGGWSGQAERCASRDWFIGLAAFLADLRSAPPSAAIPSLTRLPRRVIPAQYGWARIPPNPDRCSGARRPVVDTPHSGPPIATPAAPASSRSCDPMPPISSL